MDDIRKLIDDLAGETRSSIGALRAEMKAGFEEQQRAIAHQAHVLDQGLAEVDEMFARHRENVSKVVAAVWGELLDIKSQNVDILRRLSDLEGRKAG